MKQKAISNKLLGDEITQLFTDYKYSSRTDMKDYPIIKFIGKYGRTGQIVLDVGGNNGNFLENVLRYTAITKVVNLEFVPFFANKNNVNNINFVNASALNLPFNDNTFDFVNCSFVLHHLVGSSRRMSADNASRAIEEMARVTRNGGYIIIEEVFTRYKILSILVFYILMYLSKCRLAKYFGIKTNCIIAYITTKEIKKLIGKLNITIRVIKFKMHPFTLTLTGYVYLIGSIKDVCVDRANAFNDE